MDIGQILREAREEKQLTLDDIQQVTKIQKRYLISIEQNDFNSLPGRFYARAFIKEFAQAVDLDAGLLLAKFDDTVIDTEEEVPVFNKLARSSRPRAEKSSTIFSLLPTLIVIILIIAIVIVAWTLSQKALSSEDSNLNTNKNTDEIVRNSPDEKNANNNAEQTDNDDSESDNINDNAMTNNDENGQEDKSGEFSVVEEGTTNPPTSIVDYRYNAEEAIVKLEVTDNAYLAISGASGETYFDGMVEADMDLEAIDVSAEDVIYFNIGDTRGLTFAINDDSFDYPIAPDERIHQKYTINLQKINE